MAATAARAIAPVPPRKPVCVVELELEESRGGAPAASGVAQPGSKRLPLRMPSTVTWRALSSRSRRDSGIGSSRSRVRLSVVAPCQGSVAGSKGLPVRTSRTSSLLEGSER